MGTALGLTLKTLPFALIRFAILAGSAIAGLAISALALYLYTKWAKADSSAMGLLLVLCLVMGTSWHFILRYSLYLLKAGHVAVLTELITRGQVGDQGEGMLSYGKRQVTERFGQVNVSFAVDSAVRGVVRAFNRTLDFVASLLPIPGLDSAVSAVNAVVYASTTYMDETILSYSMVRRDTNPWDASRQGLVYYAQNAKPILKTGVWIVVLDAIATALVWGVMYIPAAVVTMAFPETLGITAIATFILAGVLAANARTAFLKPLFLTMVMVKFHTTIQGQEVHPGWDQRLASVSDKFREMSEKASSFFRQPKSSRLGSRAQGAPHAQVSSQHGYPEPARANPSNAPTVRDFYDTDPGYTYNQ